MNVIEAITSRKSTRAYLDRPVDLEIIQTILDASKHAPSSVNTQPWFVHVLTGESRQQLTDGLIAAYKSGQKANPDYHSYPQVWVEPYKSRRFSCGKALYEALDISYEDKAKREQNWLENYRFFGAPVELIVLVDAAMEKGSWVDIGMFLENIMLAAEAFGLGSCAQASVAGYPDTVREVLKLGPELQVVCGVAIGYPNPEHPVNQYQTAREPVENFVTWHD